MLGDIVLLNRKNIALLKLSKKFNKQYLGLFKILKKVRKLAYLLDLLVFIYRIHPMFYIFLLKP